MSSGKGKKNLRLSYFVKSARGKTSGKRPLFVKCFGKEKKRMGVKFLRLPPTPKGVRPLVRGGGVGCVVCWLNMIKSASGRQSSARKNGIFFLKEERGGMPLCREQGREKGGASSSGWYFRRRVTSL